MRCQKVIPASAWFFTFALFLWEEKAWIDSSATEGNTGFCKLNQNLVGHEINLVDYEQHLAWELAVLGDCIKIRHNPHDRS